jgi:serine/threonine-protein kinase
MLHRDIKQENIFLCDPLDSTQPRIVKLLDFGLAKILQARRQGTPAPEYTTEEGVSLGTPRFFAPEQVAYGRLDERTDIYGMGLVLYSLVAGRGPFDHLTELRDILEAHVWILPERPSHFAPQPIPPAIDEVILKALAKRPEHRFPSAHAFAEALWLALLPRPRWVSTEPLDQNAMAAARAMGPPPAPAPRWTDTDPLPTLRWPTSGGTPSPQDPSAEPQ